MEMMKRTHLLLAGILLFFSAINVHADQAEAVDLSTVKHPIEPMLWKVEGKGLKKPSYLFGTVHLADPRVTTLHPEAKKAFDGAGAFYAEVEMDPESMMKSVQVLLRGDGKSLEEVIGNPLRKDVEIEVKSLQPGLELKPFEGFKVWALAVLLPQLKDQIKGLKPLDLQLWERAEQANKSVAGLETPKSQTEGMDKLTIDEQKKLLVFTLDEMKQARKAKQIPYQLLFNAYLVGDVKAMTVLLKNNMLAEGEVDKDLSDKFAEALLYKRNKQMAGVIVKELKNQPEISHFFAVGTAHYLGKENICQYLEKAGYKVTLVRDEK